MARKFFKIFTENKPVRGLRKKYNTLYVTRSIVIRNVPQRTFLRNRLLICLHREKSHKIQFQGFGIFG